MMGTRATEHRGSRRLLAGQSVHEPSVCEEPDPLNTYVEKPLTMYQWMRWSNCKTHKPHLEETYPSILPPISRCDDAKTLKYVEEAMEANKCKHYPKEDVLAVWNQSPQKESLGWYGIGSQYPSPQAVLYDRAVKKSLKAASLLPKPPKKSNIKPKWQLEKKPPQPGAFVLNRKCLTAKLDRMPNIRRQLKSTNVFSWLHCPQPADPTRPFEDSAGYPAISREQAMDMVKPEKPAKHGLRRKHWYCPPKCGEVENKCTDYEWAKYKMDPRPDNEAFQREMAAQQAFKQPEPRNYDELYKSLVTCFVQDPDGKNDLCQALEKCCRDPKDPPVQGCGEFVPDGAGGDGESAGNKDKGGDKDLDVDKDENVDVEDEDNDKQKDKGKKDDGEGDTGNEGIEDGDDDGKDKGKGGQKDKGKGKGDGEGNKGPEKDGGDKKKEKPNEVIDKEKDKNKDKGKGKDKKPKDENSRGSEDRPLVPRSTDTIPATEGSHRSGESGGHGGASDGEKDLDKNKKDPNRTDSTIDQKPPKDKDKGKGKGKDKGPNKNKGKGNKKDDKGNDKDNTQAIPTDNDCPCEICCPPKEEDTPLIKEMRRRDRERQVRDYLRQMRHRQYMECKDLNYPSPHHKCDAIQCNDQFCSNPRMQTHFARVQAVRSLQQILQKRNRKGDVKISNDLDSLLTRLCNSLTISGGHCR
ncbi:uncharacterized protein LOC6526293 isoform X1 [Drosophila yakuba]|uniref:Uncharacterized protein, isoform B n=1 Tax=Drosophila yakuba TaxID=7245 RepID=A0A0R1DKS2_DROYA|nr:uncharacterized protein LOC6526293 isoform X1 [Drosophila yakuba]KRJ97037.1 uncharacterized protein Dyak_GE16195, isoform B [Drosophila yakuba]